MNPKSVLNRFILAETKHLEKLKAAEPGRLQAIKEIREATGDLTGCKGLEKRISCARLRMVLALQRFGKVDDELARELEICYPTSNPTVTFDHREIASKLENEGLPIRIEGNVVYLEDEAVVTDTA